MTSREFPPGYSGLTRLLNRKFQIGRRKLKGEERIIARTEISGEVNKPMFWHLPGHKGYNIYNYKHEQKCGDLYVAYQTTGLLNRWEDGHVKEYTDLGLVPDRVSVIDKKIIFWEVERGTKLLSTVEEK